MNPQNRRQFLTVSGTAALASCLDTLSAQTSQDLKTKKLKIGIVGLGGRGSGAIRNALNADPNTVLWAVGDVNKKAEKAVELLKKQKKNQVDCDGRVYYGYDSFEKVASSGIDIILLTTPPAFRPAQIKRSFEKGLHVFAEKPWCVDSPGLQIVKDAVEAGNKKGLSFLTGLVWRYTLGAKQLYETALSGELGDILTSHGYYYSGPIGRGKNYKPENFKTIDQHNSNGKWFSFVDLSGDWVLEQFIHTVDKLSWAMKDEAPLRCYGVGGRPFDYSIRNLTEHINITYEFEDGRRSYLNGSHVNKFTTIHDEIFATKGMTHLSNARSYIKKEGKMAYKIDNTPLGYVQEHKEFISEIRKGNVFTDIKSSYNTHLLALMARLASYSGQEIYPEDVLESEEVFFDSEKKWDYDTPFQARPFSNPMNYKL